MIWILAAEGAPSADGAGPAGLTAARLLARPDTIRRGDAPGGRSRVATEPTAEIIERARSGDPDAFASLFRTHADDVLRVCRRMLGSPESAADAQSEVFLKARRALEGYDAERPFRAWLLAIASHHCIDQLRRAATERRIFADAGVEPADLAGPDPSPLTRLLAREKVDALDRALETLPLEYRLPLLLRYHSDASYDEIAAVLGTTRARVGTLIFRAKRRLREQLTRAPEHPGQRARDTGSADASPSSGGEGEGTR